MGCILVHTALVAQGRARKSKQNNGEVVCSRKRESCTTRFNVQDTDRRQSFYYTISTLKKFVLFYIIFAVWAFAAVRVHFIFVSTNEQVWWVFSSSVIFTHKSHRLDWRITSLCSCTWYFTIGGGVDDYGHGKTSVVVAEINDHNCHRWRTRKEEKKTQQGWKGSKEKRNPLVSQEFPCPLYLMYCTSLLRGENETHFFLCETNVKENDEGKRKGGKVKNDIVCVVLQILLCIYVVVVREKFCWWPFCSKSQKSIHNNITRNTPAKNKCRKSHFVYMVDAVIRYADKNLSSVNFKKSRYTCVCTHDLNFIVDLCSIQF